jgi:hypothetical protein
LVVILFERRGGTSHIWLHISFKEPSSQKERKREGRPGGIIAPRQPVGKKIKIFRGTLIFWGITSHRVKQKLGPWRAKNF